MAEYRYLFRETKIRNNITLTNDMKTIIIYILTFAILSSVAISAQTTSKMYVIEGSTQFLEGELIDREIKDANGEVCAAVVIISDMQGLSFQSYNGIVKTNSNPGRHFVFVSPTERVVEVFKSGYKPLKIILNDYGINLKSGQAWEIEVTGDKLTSDLIPISIVIQPSGAEIFIDGESKGVTSTVQLSKGMHQIKIIKSGYSVISETIDVSEKNILFNYKLEIVELVTVTIKSIPTEATIIINGVEEGKTDDQIFKYPGKYKLKLIKSGFLDVEKEIDLTAKGNNLFSYNLDKNTATLNLKVTPTTAKVLINKKDYTNQANVELAPGKYQIEISQSGYEPLIEYVELTLGKGVTKTFSLTQQMGGFQFKVKPIDAKVALKQNGITKYEWSGAKILNNIPVGSYLLECKMNDYKEESKTINITKNNTSSESIELIKLQSNSIKQSSNSLANKSSENMVFVKGGTFQMGGDDGEMDEKPTHSVTLNDFYISKYEVTFAEYDKFCDATGRSKPNDRGWGRGSRPVINVSWDDAVAYCTWAGGRLPTEAEWEYAARGGTQSKAYTHSGSNDIDKVAWYTSNSGRETHEVGAKKPNELGTYDMSGNVWEWCSDWYDESYYISSPSNNPQGPSPGTNRVLRGGSWDIGLSYCRSANRDWFSPSGTYSDHGFRFVHD